VLAYATAHPSSNTTTFERCPDTNANSFAKSDADGTSDSEPKPDANHNAISEPNSVPGSTNADANSIAITVPHNSASVTHAYNPTDAESKPNANDSAYAKPEPVANHCAPYPDAKCSSDTEP
jgi:hypothetical protein